MHPDAAATRGDFFQRVIMKRLWQRRHEAGTAVHQMDKAVLPVGAQRVVEFEEKLQASRSRADEGDSPFTRRRPGQQAGEPGQRDLHPGA